MPLFQVAILALIQGLAEMLPVSSSAHVIFAQKLMGADPSSPEMTFLLVMLHTGTMLAALLYFRKRWFAQSATFFKRVVLATLCTGAVGLLLKLVIEKLVLERLLGHSKGEVEALFGNLVLIAAALFAAGLLILWSNRHEAVARAKGVPSRSAAVIGLIQGFCLPFRGFSRSGATISSGMAMGISRELAEEFSFALAVALTPAAIALETHRLAKSIHEGFSLVPVFAPGLFGMVFSFLGAWLALRWLSSWLERGKWNYFGHYCLGFACVLALAAMLGL